MPNIPKGVLSFALKASVNGLSTPQITLKKMGYKKVGYMWKIVQPRTYTELVQHSKGPRSNKVAA